MKRLLLFLISVFLAPPGPSSAENIPADRAQRLAAEFFRTSATRTAAARMQLVWDGTEPATRADGSAPAFYVFNRAEGGFVVIAGDDRARPVLGYSPSGRFAAEHMPANIREWFANIRSQIDAGRKTGASATERTRQAWERISMQSVGTEVVRLETARWNQYAPYNNLCPIIDGTHALTGCVPTAAAIVMRYHEWPDRGEGSLPAYTYELDGYIKEIKGHALGHAYDWDNMPLDYDTHATSAQNAQVARLIYDLGVMSHAMYDSATSSGTAVYTEDALSGLKKHMRYDKGAVLCYRDSRAEEQWNRMIKEEIRRNGPVLYSGSSDTSAHQFVLDGYTTADYFHVNWGWGGQSDGYFLLTALDPYELGAGGGWGGYNYRQSAIVGLVPDKTGDSAYADVLLIGPSADYDTNGLSASTDTFFRNVPFELNLSYIWNYGEKEFAGSVVPALCDREGGFKQEIAAPQQLSLYAGYGTTMTFACTITAPIACGDCIRIRYKGPNAAEWQWAYGNTENAAFEIETGQAIDAATSLSFDRTTRTLTLTTRDGATYILTDAGGNEIVRGGTKAEESVRIETHGLSGRCTLRLQKGAVEKRLTLNFGND